MREKKENGRDKKGKIYEIERRTERCKMKMFKMNRKI